MTPDFRRSADDFPLDYWELSPLRVSIEAVFAEAAGELPEMPESKLRALHDRVVPVLMQIAIEDGDDRAETLAVEAENLLRKLAS